MKLCFIGLNTVIKRYHSFKWDVGNDMLLFEFISSFGAHKSEYSVMCSL